MARHGEQACARGEQHGHREPCSPATASNVSQGAWLARHGEQTTWEASCLSSGFSILHFWVLFTCFALNQLIGMSIKVLKGLIFLQMILN